jgi:hypothetical protein
MLLVAAGLAEAACPSLAADVDETAREVLAAYEDLDEDAYAAGQRRLAEELDCLTEPLPPDLDAEVHGLVGLDAFLAGDEARARAAFRAAGAWSPPMSLFPPGHPIYAAMAAAREEEIVVTPPEPEDVEVLPTTAPRRRAAPLAWGVAAGVSGATAGVLYGVAWAERARFDDPALPDDEIEPTARRVNGAVAAAAVSGGVALACVTAAVLTVRW